MKGGKRFLALMMGMFLLGTFLIVYLSEDESDINGVEYFANQSTPKPPNLTIRLNEEKLTPILGTYSWSEEKESGSTSVEAEAEVPPVLTSDQEPFQVTADTSIVLDFEKQPETYSVRVWSQDSTIAGESKEVKLPEQGEIIYEIVGKWNEGTATYVFKLVAD